jgi:hypothetical protein
MEEERMRELRLINSSLPLSEYYQTFTSLFSIVYKTGKMVLTYMYYNKTHELKADRFQVVNALLGSFREPLTAPEIKRMELMAVNLYEMSKEEREFERRIEYVARKITTCKEKAGKIERAFLDEPLKLFWSKLTCELKSHEKYGFIEDMLESYSKRLCFYDVQLFLRSHLTSEEFQGQIEKYCGRQEVDDDLSLDYTF